MRLTATTLALALAAAPLAAEEVTLSDGRTVTGGGFELETRNDTGVKTLIFNMVPNFDPEPVGELPSDDFARLHETLCNALVRANAEAIGRDGITRFRARWQWTPEQDPENVAAGITVTRSHQNDFEIGEDLTCRPIPSEVLPEDVALTTPTGLGVRLRYAETHPETGNLDLVYEIDRPLADASKDLLQNAAMELCVLHADGVLAHRAKYYGHLGHEHVVIVFAESGPGAGNHGYRFRVENDACVSGLSADLVDFIRSSR